MSNRWVDKACLISNADGTASTCVEARTQENADAYNKAMERYQSDVASRKYFGSYEDWLNEKSYYREDGTDSDAKLLENRYIADNENFEWEEPTRSK